MPIAGMPMPGLMGGGQPPGMPGMPPGMPPGAGGPPMGGAPPPGLPPQLAAMLGGGGGAPGQPPGAPPGQENMSTANALAKLALSMIQNQGTAQGFMLSKLMETLPKMFKAENSVPALAPKMSATTPQALPIGRADAMAMQQIMGGQRPMGGPGAMIGQMAGRPPGM